MPNHLDSTRLTRDREAKRAADRPLAAHGIFVSSPQSPQSPRSLPELTLAQKQAALRVLVTEQGRDVDAACEHLGVEPLIGRCWLLVADATPPPGPAPASTPAPRPSGVTLDAACLNHLSVLQTAHVPRVAYDRLREIEAGGRDFLAAASQAVRDGLQSAAAAGTRAGWWAQLARRPVGVVVRRQEHADIVALAGAHFAGDARLAAGWLLARGLGLALPLPAPEDFAAGAPQAVAAGAAPPRWWQPQAQPMRQPRTPKVPLPPDNSAPGGEELAQRRREAGLSQRDLAAAADLSRGLVAEIERGRRRHVSTRLKLAETLERLNGVRQ
jgi:DNA-binding XRE family transcriptional regulator